LTSLLVFSFCSAILVLTYLKAEGDIENPECPGLWKYRS
jgi:hypothetical protein